MLDSRDFTKIEPLIHDPALYFQLCKHCKKEIEDENFAYCDDCFKRMRDLQEKILFKQGSN